jgi:hypothetical protein
MPRTPHSYRRASWHGTLPLDPDEGVVGVSMRWAQGVERFAVDRPSAVRLLASLAEALGYELRSPAGTQSPTSSLIPSLARSVPSDGVNVCPPAASPTAPGTSS